MAKVLNPFYLSDWLVDGTANRLYRGDTELKLESRVMAVLVYLAQHQGELVTRESLEQAVWGDTVVGYDALTRCIAKLRKILGDDTRTPRYIETIPKKGYRLIGEITWECRRAEIETPQVEVPVQQGNPRPRLGTAAALLIGLAFIASLWLALDVKRTTVPPEGELPAIAILPFVNLGSETEHDFFSEGITADLATALSKLSGLLVIAHSTFDDWPGPAANVRQIAESLGVRYILDGHVRRSGERLRITVNLLDATRDVYLWSEKYDRELYDVFAVQDDITSHIVDTLSVKFTEEEKRRTALRYTSSVDAYIDFLRGRALYNQHTRESNLLAREHYQRAIDRDSHFARAYSSMAMTYVAEHRYGWRESSPALLDKALELATKGVALDKDLPQAHWVLANTQLFRKSYDEATKAARRAIELEPNFADSYITLAACKMYFGATDEAMQLVRRAMTLNPKYPAAYASVLGQVHFFLGEYEQAVMALREAIHHNANLLTPRAFLIVALRKLERDDEAKWEAAQLETIAPNFSADSAYWMFPIQNTEIIEDMRRQLQLTGF